MVRYSDELLDEIKSKNDILDIVSQYVTLKRTGRNYVTRIWSNQAPEIWKWKYPLYFTWRKRDTGDLSEEV